ncbi:ASCH domain-containing protein [Pediococcus siamensis]|uniref:ASCH domain-containing protein n=1 Tax=Pediococcus siamensis TaxID=381829 RepID=UPI0039A1D77D
MATSAEQMWNTYAQAHDLTDKTFQTRWFGDQENPEEIRDLTTKILAKDKISTSRPLAYYASEGEQIPQPGDYYVLLDAEMHPVGIIETVVSELIPFLRVSAEHAYNEAEGERTLADWQARSLTKFTEQMKKFDRNFSTNDPILCEVIKLAYKE